MRMMSRDLTYRWRFMPPFPRPFPLPPEPTLPPFGGGPLVITAGGARVPQDGVTPWDMALRVVGIVVSEMERLRVRLRRNWATKMVENLVQMAVFDELEIFCGVECGWVGESGRENLSYRLCKKIWWIKKRTNGTREKRVIVNETLETWTVSAPARYPEEQSNNTKGTEQQQH